MPKKRVKKHCIFDPKKLTDRQLLLLLLFEVGKLRCDIAVVRNFILQSVAINDLKADSIFEVCDKQAFADLAKDIQDMEAQSETRDRTGELN